MWLSGIIYGLSLFSALWLWLGLSYISTEIGFHDLGSVNPSDLGVMVASITLPILIAILVMILAYNHIYIKNLFNNQQAFIKLLQKKSDQQERIESQKLDLLFLKKFEKMKDDLFTDIANVISNVGVLQNDEVQKLWQLYANGNKNAFFNIFLEGSMGGTISARIEAKVIQEEDFAEKIFDICNKFDVICSGFMKYDYEQVLYNQLINSPVAMFIKKVSSYKKMQQNIIDKRMDDSDDSMETILIDEDMEDELDWSKERNELIDKYRKFASDVKTNIDKGTIDED